MTDRGAFISIEGGDGAGKSTQLEFIEQYFQDKGIDYLLTREPGGTELAEHIRALILQPDSYPIEDAGTEVMLMMSARMHHLNKVIRPKLNEGTWVICDRFTDSTIAYQGYGSGYDVEKILRLADIVHGDCWPDLTLLFDIPIEVGAARRAERDKALDRFEAEDDNFQQLVRQGYIAMSKQFPERITVIDANQNIARVRNDVVKAMDSLMAHREMLMRQLS